MMTLMMPVMMPKAPRRNMDARAIFFLIDSCSLMTDPIGSKMMRTSNTASSIPDMNQKML